MKKTLVSKTGAVAKAISLVLVTALCFTYMGAVVAYGAEAPKPKTNAERIAAIKETYGFTVDFISNFEPAYIVPEGERALILTNIETGMACLGSGLTKKLVAADVDNKIEINVGNRGTNPGIVHPSRSSSTGKTDMFIMFLRKDASVSTVVHELGHIVDIVINDQAIGSKKEPWNNVTYRNNSNWAGLTPSGSFISEHAKTSDEENYAESFEYGVTNGADKPYTGSKDGQVYKCLKAVFDDLVSFAGYGSRATQRMAGYLGIDISAQIAALQK